jgi:hypothetical protein
MKIEEAKMIFQKYFKDGPGKDFVMSVMDSIEIAPAQETKINIESPKLTEEEIKAESSKSKIPQAAVHKPKQAPKKPKICNNCGKEYIPNSGVQKICPDCKKLFADIKATAKEMARG